MGLKHGAVFDAHDANERTGRLRELPVLFILLDFIGL